MNAVPNPNRLQSLFSPVLSLMQTGHTGTALDALRAIEAAHPLDAEILQHVAQYFMTAQQNADAVRLYRSAVSLRPGSPEALYNLATALIATGDTAEAETLLDQVIARDPDDYDAWYNRSTLRRQTPGTNHVAAMEALINGRGADKGEVALGYALAKEFEDLGQSAEAFHYLRRAADRRRCGLSYAVESDLEAMADIRSVFDGAYLAEATAGFASDAPIFVMGLPRSGTTLVDRIISSHHDVQSLGEINDFALCLTALAKDVQPVAKPGKAGLIRAARQVDPAALGQAYVASVMGYGVSRPCFIDKTPANYLYVGLILKALPNARIVHLRRDPMDNGYALYKTLFRMGCPYSYDLADIGRYMLGHHTLMQHWRAIAPGRIIDVDYEDLVGDTENQTRRLIGALGLDWQDACLRFHENRSAAATASAVQVRQPVYATSVGLWRRYETQLSPLADVLRQGGLL